MGNELIPIFNLHICAKLINAGFMPVIVEPNRENDKFYVFKFKASPQLINSFNEIKQEHIDSLNNCQDNVG